MVMINCDYRRTVGYRFDEILIITFFNYITGVLSKQWRNKTCQLEIIVIKGAPTPLVQKLHLTQWFQTLNWLHVAYGIIPIKTYKLG